MWIHSRCGGPAAFGTSVDFGLSVPPGRQPSDGYWCEGRCMGASTGFNRGHPSDDPRNWRADTEG
ncbi:hypothetical protein SEA_PHROSTEDPHLAKE_35 [Gordonia phage PhrostedPhlake]|nr:hypothetical protein SEA_PHROSTEDPHLAKE_35 [Gordonia phage PhrostedPhlake]